MTVPESNPCFVLEDGMLYTKDKTQLYFCLRNTSGSITVPDGVVVIKNYAFCNCKEITRILLPDSVRYIFNNAFSDCTSLQSITLPSRMSLVSNDTF
ncbi:MAG: leucine-rich repeat protein, partial [Blautia sp.]|nr:leucine-rich repeat protein [Blautia sp.]